MPAFLTVKEAAKLTGKSSSSIRRVIYPIIKDDAHADRQHIAPTVDEAQALRVKGENFAWRISEELLHRVVPVTPASQNPSAASQAMSDGHSELLSMLRRELDIKNQQITQQTAMLTKQMELIDGLSERLREGNILIGSLQKQLALPDGTRMQPRVVDAKRTQSAPKKGSTEKGSSVPKTMKKKGFFAKLFR